MIRNIIFAVLLAAGPTAPLLAQNTGSYWPFNSATSRAEATFSLCPRCINHRHKAPLGVGNSLMVELMNHSGYRAIEDLEGTLAALRRDAAFLDDSIAACPQCNFRLDYYVAANGTKSYRLRSYPPQGTFLYVKGGDAPQPFKAEPDTLHLLISGPPREGTKYPVSEQAQVTLVLNRYANLEALLGQKGRINHLIDTMRQRSAPRTRAQRGAESYRYKTSINLYRSYPDTSRLRLYYRRGVLPPGTEADFSGHSAFDVQLNFGAGFLRDRLAPVAEGGLVYRLPGSRGDNTGELLVGLYGSGYFAFSKGEDGHYNLQDNWFLNAEFGGETDDDHLFGTRISRSTMALGYLVSRKGDFFQGTTMKLSLNVRLKNGCTLSPEIIGTDNLHQFFPGFTIKVF